MVTCINLHLHSNFRYIEWFLYDTTAALDCVNSKMVPLSKDVADKVITYLIKKWGQGLPQGLGDF